MVDADVPSGDSRGLVDSWKLTNVSEYSAESGGSEILELSTPPLVIISSRVKYPGTLTNCSNPEVAVVRYTYESTTLAKLLQMVAAKMRGRQALSIALVVHGEPGLFKLCSQKVSMCISISSCFTSLYQLRLR